MLFLIFLALIGLILCPSLAILFIILIAVAAIPWYLEKQKWDKINDDFEREEMDRKWKEKL